MRTFRVHAIPYLLLFALFVIAQGFQCVSSEMTTAKLAVRNKEWQKAEQNLLQELQKRPKNGEAWYLLARVRYEMGNIDGMLEAVEQAQQYVTDPRQKRDLGILLYRGWIEQFNAAAEQYNRGITSQDQEALKKAKEHLDRAIRLKPENSENYELLGYVYDALGDTVSAIRAFEQYLQSWEKERTFLVQQQLHLGMTKTAVENKLQSPAAIDSVPGSADRIVATYVHDRDTIYAFYQQENSQWVLKGIRINPPSHWLPQEKKRFTPLSIQPYLLLADYYYRHKQLQKALQYLQSGIAVGGPQEDFLRLQAGILQEVGKQEEALAAVRSLIERFPENKTYRVVYGSLLAQMGKVQEAIAQFEEALKIDPNFDMALFNLGAIYKNMASEIQQEEKKLIDQKKKEFEDTTRYFPLLRKSAAYFERYRAIPGKSSDFIALRELLNVYQVLQDTTRYRALVEELKKMEPLYRDNPEYYELMGSIYTRENKIEEAKKAFERADQLRNQQK